MNKLFDNELNCQIENAIASMIESTKKDEIQWIPLFFMGDDANVSSILKAVTENTCNVNVANSYYYNVYPGNVVVLSFEDSDENISFWFQTSIYSEVVKLDRCFEEKMFVLRNEIREYMNRISKGKYQVRNFLERAIR